jgi:hypothetical protein
LAHPKKERSKEKTVKERKKKGKALKKRHIHLVFDNEKVR